MEWVLLLSLSFKVQIGSYLSRATWVQTGQVTSLSVHYFPTLRYLFNYSPSNDPQLPAASSRSPS